eukprot:TRINITY_DN34873_c0_g1_i1.p1 TRINITY_DN34873_c0_g1~~TRINITY_DN34873_c0_g1_i1.p1  ORF type:complete len:575 (-),score=94.37 TRINITY_DN34873_c0_g1_i1:115-1839(-)
MVEDLDDLFNRPQLLRFAAAAHASATAAAEDGGAAGRGLQTQTVATLFASGFRPPMEPHTVREDRMEVPLPVFDGLLWGAAPADARSLCSYHCCGPAGSASGPPRLGPSKAADRPVAKVPLLWRLVRLGLGRILATVAVCVFAVAGVLFLLMRPQSPLRRREAHICNAGSWLSPQPCRGFCAEKAPLPRLMTKPLAFNLSEHWAHKCRVLRGPEATGAWKDSNECWAWVKRECYRQSGNVSWAQCQTKAGAGLLVPPMEETVLGLQRSQTCDHPSHGALASFPSRHGNETRAQRLAADRAWFNANVQVYVVNLQNATHRWQRISDHLHALGIEGFTRIEGVNMMHEGAVDAVKQEGLMPPAFDVVKASVAALSKENYMGGLMGTLGCATAHMRALAHAGAHSAKPLSLILEDDVSLVDDSLIKVRHLLEQEAPCDWQVIALRSNCPYGECVSRHLSRVRPDGNEPASRCHHGVNYGFYSMLYRTATVWHVRKTLYSRMWKEDEPRCLDIDVALAAVSNSVGYYAVPGSQYPGLVQLIDEGSTRSELDEQAEGSLQEILTANLKPADVGDLRRRR